MGNSISERVPYHLSKLYFY